MAIQQPRYQRIYQNISQTSSQSHQDGHTCQNAQQIPPANSNPETRSNTFIPIHPLHRPPRRDLFANDQERLYFQRFCEISAAQLTGCLESDLWSRVVLQASETAPCIRHAVTAIGTLNLKGWRETPPSPSPAQHQHWHSDLEKKRLQFAYHEYQSAIVGMRRESTEGETDIRTKLLACLLFACFETYHGNRDVAAAQVFAGIEAIDEYNRLRASTEPTLPPIDEEIVRIFVILEIQATTYQDRRSRALHLERLNRGRDAVEDMPTEFHSLKEARLPLTRIVLRGIHLTMSQREVDHAVHPSIVDLWWISERPPPTPSPDLSFSSHPAKIPDPDPNNGINSSISTVDPIYALQCNILSEYKRWETAFTPLLRKARGPKGRSTFHAATLLHIHYLSGVLCLAATTPHPLYYHRCYTRELTEVVDLAHLLLEDSNQSLLGDAYSLDIGVVMPLIVVGYKYRHRALRRRIIETFGRVRRREGIWDVDVTGRVMAWVAGIEEAGLEGEEVEEYVPEERVATIVRMETDLVGRVSRVAVMVREGGVGEVVEKETVIAW
ncbi:hypothetical protein DL98DRAFT_649931 [Cadophora sp. DSE1049]|nr:hypothetical protein DL98DRAFT_649931 [Cadophora sp. DSE1049]